MTKGTKKGLLLGAIVLGAIAGLAALLWPRRASAAGSLVTGGVRMSPTEIQTLIIDLCRRAGIPAWFGLANAELESGFDPRAHNAEGSYGLMQIYWRVHETAVRALGAAGPEALYDPQLNVSYWTRIVGQFAHGVGVDSGGGVEDWGKVRLRLAGVTPARFGSDDAQRRLARYRPVAAKWQGLVG